MTKIRKSAKGEDCTIRLPGVCNFDPETTVLAHAPHHRKGIGNKAPDYWSAYSCSSCHLALDNRAHPIWQAENYYLAWFQGIRETQDKLMEKGLLAA